LSAEIAVFWQCITFYSWIRKLSDQGCDKGIGLDRAFLLKIFQPFSTCITKTDTEGAVLRLSICQKSVEWHKGSIRIDSEPEERRGLLLSR
jgi:light-regulated signal transduction histidine kinase (bacteriophytochrome)